MAEQTALEKFQDWVGQTRKAIIWATGALAAIVTLGVLHGQAQSIAVSVELILSVILGHQVPNDITDAQAADLDALARSEHSRKAARARHPKDAGLTEMQVIVVAVLLAVAATLIVLALTGQFSGKG